LAPEGEGGGDFYGEREIYVEEWKSIDK